MRALQVSMAALGRTLVFDWLINLISHHRDTSRQRSPTTDSESPFPNRDTASDCDDQGLFVTAGCESALRYYRDGFDSLNDAERALCCLYLLEANVNNGGFGKWIDGLCPQSAAETPRILRKIGATEMASFVAEALAPLGETTAISSKDEWVQQYLSMPDSVHEYWEGLSRRFLQLEEQFLELSYSYARENWREVRMA